MHLAAYGESRPHHFHGRGHSSQSTNGQQQPATQQAATQQSGPQQVQRQQSISQSDQSSLKLTVKTAEGDTVDISVDALQRLKFATSADGSKLSTSEAVKASINVKGDLSDAETSDILKLLNSVAGGQAPTSGYSTLSAYAVAYQRNSDFQYQSR